MSLEELKTAAMAALYGPLAKGAEKERWRRVEVTPTDADAKSEDSWASEKEEKEAEREATEAAINALGLLCVHHAAQVSCFIKPPGTAEILPVPPDTIAEARLKKSSPFSMHRRTQVDEYV